MPDLDLDPPAVNFSPKELIHKIPRREGKGSNQGRVVFLLCLLGTLQTTLMPSTRRQACLPESGGSNTPTFGWVIEAPAANQLVFWC